MVVIDFETRSKCDLPARGADNYALDGTTDILCMAFYNLETEYKEIWHPDKGDPSPLIVAGLTEADFVVAHNAEFDKAIYEYVALTYGFPEIEPSRWYCSSAQARVNGLPASLNDAAWAAGLRSRKMASGKDLIRKLSIPQKDGTFNTDPALMEEMREYCMQDVIVTANLLQVTRPMMADEHSDWLKTVEVNNRGVKVDKELARLAIRYASNEADDIRERIAKLTNGEVTSHTQTARIRAWVVKELTGTPELELMKVGTKFTLDKAARSALLDADLADNVREIVELLDDGNKSSVAKFKRMLELADDEDDRVRGAFVYAGATQTLRYTSRGLQLHNMRRDCYDAEEAEVVLDAMRDGAPLTQYGSTMDVLSKMLRPALIPAEGNVFVVGDWSSIEARVLPWLSDTDGGDARLKIFESGKDIYTETATAMRLNDRQIGKVAELACGYQGGRNAFKNMAKNYGLNLDEDQAQYYVNRWREANPWAVAYWAELDKAAMEAYLNPGETIQAGMLDYVFVSGLLGGTLLCQMPNNTVIQYPSIKVEEGQYGYFLTSVKASVRPKADATEWTRSSLYGGLLAENATQAFAAAILRNTLRKLDNVVASCHDEIILEVPRSAAKDVVAQLKNAMCETPEWAEGLPLVAEPAIMSRYGKA